MSDELFMTESETQIQGKGREFTTPEMKSYSQNPPRINSGSRFSWRIQRECCGEMEERFSGCDALKAFSVA